jgi:hypothetical protein
MAHAVIDPDHHATGRQNAANGHQRTEGKAIAGRRNDLVMKGSPDAVRRPAKALRRRLALPEPPAAASAAREGKERRRLQSQFFAKRVAISMGKEDE